MYEKFLEEVEEFIFYGKSAEQADIIFVPGNSYPYMAGEKHELYMAGMAPVILPRKIQHIFWEIFGSVWKEKEKNMMEIIATEWEFLRDVLIKNEVPESVILERKIKQLLYLAECSFFKKSYRSFGDEKVKQSNFYAVKDYHARRAFMYYQRGVSRSRNSGMPLVLWMRLQRKNWKLSAWD